MILILAFSYLLFVAVIVAFYLHMKTPVLIINHKALARKYFQEMKRLDEAQPEIYQFNGRLVDFITCKSGEIRISVEGLEEIRINLDSAKPLKKYFLQGNLAQLIYYSFEVQRRLLQIYRENPDKRILTLIRQSIADFSADKRGYFRNPYYWYDHCTANRLYFFREYLHFTVKQGLYEEREYTKIVSSLIQHALFISRNASYDFVTNHGLIVDLYGSIATSDFYAIPFFRRLTERYLSRSLGRIDHYISDDGVPLESATSYWFLIYYLYYHLFRNAQRRQINVSEYTISKIAKAEKFLRSIEINGQLNRVGDSANGNRYPHFIFDRHLPFTAADGYHLNILDSGLIYLTRVQGNQVLSQLMLNVQNNKPYVHQQQDALCLNLYHRNTFWFNSPGAFKTGKSLDISKIKGYRNQSVVFDEKAGFSPDCRIKSFQLQPDCRITSVVLAKGREIIERTIAFDPLTAKLSVTDHSPAGNEISTQFLLLPGAKVTQEGPGKIRVTHQNEYLDVETTNPYVVEPGQISHERNKLVDTSILRFTGLAIHLTLNLGSSSTSGWFSHTPTHYPYGKRLSYSSRRSFVAFRSLKWITRICLLVLGLLCGIVILWHLGQ